MRIAKRILAIVLSVVLVVGSFAIATSAADDPTIYLSLKAQVMDGVTPGAGAAESEALGIEDNYVATIRASKFANQTKDVAAYKEAQSSYPYYSAEDGVIEVEPGQLVWVTTHMRSVNGCYPNAVQGQVFYDTNVFVTAAMTVAAGFVWNPTNEIYQYSNTTMSGGTIYGRTTLDWREEYTPSDFTEAQDAQYNQYTWFSAADPNAIMSAPVDPEMVPPQNSNLVAVPIYVRTDAVPGTEAKIFTYSYAKLSGQRLPASDYTAEYDKGDIYESAINFQNEIFDLSGAALTFKVAGGEAALDYTALDAQIAAYEAKSADDYTTDSWANATTAYNAAVEAKSSATEQTAIDTAASNLETALANLVDKVVLDYTRINAAIASVPADLSGYTTSTASAVAAPLAAANTAVESATTQAELDDAAAALEAAVAALEEKANFANLNNILAEAVATENEGYTEATWTELQNAIAAGQAFDQNETGVSAQADVNAAYERIAAAIDNLEPEVVLDYTAWNAALAKIPADLSIYTADSVAQYEAAKTAAEASYAVAVDAKDQAGLDSAAAALEAAIATLKVQVVLDYTAWNAAQAKQPADFSGYTPASVTAYNAAVESATAAFNAAVAAENQAGIDAAAEDLEAAVAVLVDLADKTALVAAINDAPEYASEYYSNWADYENALVSANEVNDDANASQAAVDAATADLVNAKNALTLAAADYSDVEAAIAEAAEVNRDLYTAESLAELDEAIDAVVYSYKSPAQDVVNDFAAAIRAAIANLEYLADYSAVEAAKATIPADTSIYTTDSVAKVEEAVDAVVYGLGETKQDEVNAYAAAISTAVANLVELDADYSDVEAAKAEAANVNRALYTAASLADLDEAVDAVVYGYKISAQADVDAFAAAIRAAIKALDLKPTEGAVTEVAYDTTSPYNVNDFSFKVTGRAVKICIVDCDNTALTLTYNRAAAKAAGSIVSYNAAGEVVSDLARDIAYEIWTINDLYLANGNYYAAVKDNYGWEDYDIATVFEVAPSTANSAVDSLTVANEAPVAGEAVEVTAVTGSDVLKVVFLVDGVEYKTISNPAIAEGKATFTTSVKFRKGEHTVTIKVKTADGWSEVVDGVSATVNATVEA